MANLWVAHATAEVAGDWCLERWRDSTNRGILDVARSDVRLELRVRGLGYI